MNYLLTLLLFLKCIFCFNLDTKLPIIKSSLNPDSFFGYSVALHRKSGFRSEPVLLVGAPNDHNVQPGTNKSGALYQCGLSNFIDVSIRLIRFNFLFSSFFISDSLYVGLLWSLFDFVIIVHFDSYFFNHSNLPITYSELFIPVYLC